VRAPVDKQKVAIEKRSDIYDAKSAAWNAANLDNETTIQQLQKVKK
jgi:hypothetical protein